MESKKDVKAKCKREKDRQTDRKIDRETDRQTEKQIDRQRDGETERQTKRQTERDRERWIDIQHKHIPGDDKINEIQLSKFTDMMNKNLAGSVNINPPLLHYKFKSL